MRAVKEYIKNMGEQINQMVKKVEHLQMDKLNQASPSINNMQSKGKEMDTNEGRFPTQFPI